MKIEWRNLHRAIDKAIARKLKSAADALDRDQSDRVISLGEVLRFNNALRSYIGSRIVADALTLDVIRVANHSPEHVDEIFDVAQSMAIMGVGKDLIVEFVEIAAYGGFSDVPRLSRAISRIISTGRLSGDDAKALRDVGVHVPVAGVHVGITTEALRDLLMQGMKGFRVNQARFLSSYSFRERF